MNQCKRSLGTIVLSLAAVALAGSHAEAAAININSTLTGDGRADNPDNLKVLVSITGDTTSNVSNWTIDLDMALTHPSAALHEFYFNLVGSTTDYQVSNFSPGSWSLTATNVNNAQGSGNANFMFETSGPNNTVTNLVNLTFTVTKLTGLFTTNDFLSAVSGCSNDQDLGCGQLGAHIGSLNALPGESDSGFALGIYSTSTTPPPPAVPEPASLLLLGSGLGAVAYRVRRARGKRS